MRSTQKVVLLFVVIIVAAMSGYTYAQMSAKKSVSGSGIIKLGNATYNLWMDAAMTVPAVTLPSFGSLPQIGRAHV